MSRNCARAVPRATYAAERVSGDRKGRGRVVCLVGYAAIRCVSLHRGARDAH